MKNEFEIKEASGKTFKLLVRKPNYEDYEESDKIYAGKLASLIREKGKNKLLLRTEVDSFLRDTGVWSVEDENKILGLQKDIESLLTKLKKGGDKISSGRQTAIAVMDKRKEMVKILTKKQIFDNATVESLAESEKNDYLIYKCLVYADNGNNYWESFEDMKNDKASDAYFHASTIAMSVFYNIDPEFEKSLPENKWLKKYNFINDNLQYTDRKTGEYVDRDGKPIKEMLKEAETQMQNLHGDIEELSPFTDEDGTPIIVGNKEPEPAVVSTS